MSSRPECKSCGATVRWGHAVDGRRVPLDPQPHPDGNVWIRPDDGRFRFLAKNEVARAKAAGELLYRVHHSSCPAAARHRGIPRAQEALW